MSQKMMSQKTTRRLITMRRLIITLFLILCAGGLPAQLQTVDYRYSPQWHQTCICFPDDNYKTLVGPLGQLLYDYG